MLPIAPDYHLAQLLMPKSVLNLAGYLLRLLTVEYRPNEQEQAFLARAQSQSQADLHVTVSVLSDRESRSLFGVRLARRGIQPLWISIVNRTENPAWLDLFSIDPSYYTPLEAAGLSHFSLGKRLLSFGALAWLFLPFLPLVPFKLFGARVANRHMDSFFKTKSFHPGPIKPGTEKSGFVFTTLDEGLKNIDIQVISAAQIHDFFFSLAVPGLTVKAIDDGPNERKQLQAIDESGFRAWLEAQPRSTTNKHGNVDGDPLNLVVVGDHRTIMQCFGGRWDQAETITLGTCWKTLKAFVLDSDYRYSPVSPLYFNGLMQELALQKVRSSINERLHLRLWQTPLSYEQQPVWIGQVSRDIGVRFTWKTWNLTTHRIDPDVDEARDYVLNFLIAARRVKQVGYAAGVGAVPLSAPRRNLTGDPYFTDGARGVAVLAKSKTKVSFLRWS